MSVPLLPAAVVLSTLLAVAAAATTAVMFHHHRARHHNPASAHRSMSSCPLLPEQQHQAQGNALQGSVGHAAASPVAGAYVSGHHDSIDTLYQQAPVMQTACA
jgi:hypothetical protein